MALSLLAQEISAYTYTHMNWNKFHSIQVRCCANKLLHTYKTSKMATETIFREIDRYACLYGYGRIKEKKTIAYGWKTEIDRDENENGEKIIKYAKIF